MKCIHVNVPGGPENMQLVDAPTPTPGPKQALVKIAASGVNFIDVYFRTGLYKADVPITLGSEAAGTVEAVGAEVTEVAPGDRVAYAMARGSYAEYAVVPSWQLVKIPAHVEFAAAAAAMLQGMTAHYLTHSTFPLKSGDVCLVHAAAGGAGGLIVQMAKMLGARVFGTVSTAEKAQIAREHGADETILYTHQDFEAEVRRLTGGRGVDVVYDSVGRTTSIRAWALCGRAARWRCSDNRAARCRPSTRRFSTPRDRSTSPVPAWATICRRARNCCGAPATCSIGSTPAS
jgi:NADPH2:quinone reductase